MIVLNNTWSKYRSNLFNDSRDVEKIYYLVGNETIRNKDVKLGSKEEVLGFSLFKNPLTTTQDLILSRFPMRLFAEKHLIICGWSYWQYWVTIIIRRLFSRSSYILVEGIVSRRNGFIGGMWKRWILLLFNSRHVKLLSPLNATDSYIKAYGFSKPEIVRLSNYSSHCCQAENDKRDIDFLYVGRNSLEKNIELLISLAREYPAYSFVFVGDDFGTDLPSNVLTERYTSDVSNFYCRSKTLLLLSVYEPFGMVAIEASHCGCVPVLSNKVGCAELFPKEFIVDLSNDIDLGKFISNHAVYKQKLLKFSIEDSLKQLAVLNV